MEEKVIKSAVIFIIILFTFALKSEKQDKDLLSTFEINVNKLKSSQGLKYVNAVKLRRINWELFKRKKRECSFVNSLMVNMAGDIQQKTSYERFLDYLFKAISLCPKALDLLKIIDDLKRKGYISLLLNKISQNFSSLTNEDKGIFINRTIGLLFSFKESRHLPKMYYEHLNKILRTPGVGPIVRKRKMHYLIFAQIQMSQ